MRPLSIPAFSWRWLCLVALTLFAIGCGNDGTDVPKDAPGVDASTTHEISAFGFTKAANSALPADVTATISGDAIGAPVLFGTSVTSLVASFTTNGVSVKVGGVEQTSGVTANDFTNPVTYTVTAADGTTHDYVVTITVASSTAKDLTGFSFLMANNPSMSADATAVISGTTITVTVPYGTNVASLKATFTTTGMSVKVAGVAQVSGTTANNFTGAVMYRVTAADNSTKDYTVTVTIGLNSAKDMTAFSFLAANNGSQSLTSDAVGNISGTSIAVTVPYGTVRNGLKATFLAPGATVTVGGNTQFSGSTANDFTSAVVYRVTAADSTFQDYTVTVTVAPNTAKDILTFSFLKANNPALPTDITGVVDSPTAGTISATVPFGTNVTALKATFTHTGASVTVGGVTQTSGSTANNFTSSVVYRVTAGDASTKDYTVNVAIAPASSAHDITAFSFDVANNPGLSGPDVVGSINQTNHTIAATVPFGTNVSALKATFTLSQFATVNVSGTPQTSGSTANNFTGSVTYHVIAQDNSTQDYVVTVTIAPSPAKQITAFSFTSAANPSLASTVTATVDQTFFTIKATVPYGATMSSLKATFTTTGASVTVGGVTQTSGTTANDFTTTVTYHVIAADSSTQDYTVTIIMAPTLGAFSFDTAFNSGISQNYTGAINQGAATVSLVLPVGTNVTNLAASFTVSLNATVQVLQTGGTFQTSGSTQNNFTSTLTYRVVAPDFTSKDYSVTVTLAGGVSFGSYTGFVGNTDPEAVAVGDLNGDGKVDAAIACYTSNSVEVFLNTTPTGTTGTPTMAGRLSLTWAAGNHPNDVAIADINNDGKPDLVVAATDLDAVSVLINTTAPGATTASFSAHVDFTVSTGANSGPEGVAVGDFNGDGRLDIVSSNYSSVASVLFNTTTPGAATPTFAAKVDFTTGTAPLGATVADFNLDGLLDFAVANSQSNTASVFLNTTTPGGTTASFAAKVDFTTAGAPRRIAAGDFNGDGRPDLATANNGGNNVSVLLNATTPGATTPSFSAKVDTATGTNTVDVAIADVNGDGIPDIAAATGDGNVNVLKNTTAPGATTASFSTNIFPFSFSSKPYGVELADMNGDGKPDLVTADTIANNLAVNFNTGLWLRNPTFSAKADTTAGTTPQSVSVGDVNLDGKPDVVAVNSGSANVSVLLNTTTTGTASASLAAATNFTTGTTPYQAALADINGDGKLDIVVANSGSTSISVLRNTTSPGAAPATMAAKVDFTTGTTPQSLTIGDFNHDGKPDVAVANVGSNTASVLLNTTATNSTTITFAAKADFATGTGPVAIASGDFNGDGNVDLVTANQTASTISLLFNTTSVGGTTAMFAAKADAATGTGPRAVVVGDVNGNGVPDITVANATTNNVSIFVNQTTPGSAAPTLATKADFGIGGTPTGIAMGDIDGDGRLDVLASTTVPNVGVIINSTAPGSSTPMFGSVVSYTTGTSSQALAVCQLNGDGKPDVAVANGGAATVSVLLGN